MKYQLKKEELSELIKIVFDTEDQLIEDGTLKIGTQSYEPKEYCDIIAQRMLDNAQA